MVRLYRAAKRADSTTLFRRSFEYLALQYQVFISITIRLWVLPMFEYSLWSELGMMRTIVKLRSELYVSAQWVSTVAPRNRTEEVANINTHFYQYCPSTRLFHSTVSSIPSTAKIQPLPDSKRAEVRLTITCMVSRTVQVK